MARLRLVNGYCQCGNGDCLPTLQCCCVGRRKDREIKPKATPLPWGKLLIVCAVLFVNQFGVSLLFPYLPFMIHDFFPDLDRTEIGQNAGYLGCAYYVGNFMGSLFWGWLSDIVGRRPVMMAGMVGIILSELLFAFSQNFAWAVAARFLWGALNGNFGLGKTYISEICDDTNQAKGFAVVGTTIGIANLLGSVLGGFLAQPASKYITLQFQVFCDYPYSLPMLVAAGLSVICLAAVWLFLDETLHKKKKKKQSSIIEQSDPSDETSIPSQDDSGIDLSASDPLMNSLGDESDMKMSELDPQGESDIEPLVVAESNVDSKSEFERVSSDTERPIRTRAVCPKRLSCNPLYPCIKFKERVIDCVATPIAIVKYLSSSRQRGSWSPKKSFTKERVSKNVRSVLQQFKSKALLMADRRVFLATLLYGLFAFIGIMSVELLPLLLVTEHQYGGYSMDDSELGVILMVAAILELFYQLLVFPKMTKCIGFRHTFRVGVLVFGLASFLLPFSNQITGPISDALLSNNTSLLSNNSSSGDSGYCNYTLDSNVTDTSVNENSVTRVPIYVWVTLILLTAVISTSRVMSITATMVLINNSSLPGTKGTVNGIGQALASIGRSVGPVVGAPVFAWSEGTGLGWPLNFHFVFNFMAVSSVLIVAVSFLLPKAIEQKRVMVEKTDDTPDRTIDNYSTRT